MSGDQGPDIQGFLEELPRQFEQARRHIYSSNLNLLENWSSRLEDTLNLLTILCHRSEEVHGPVDIIDSLYGLKHEAQVLRDKYEDEVHRNTSYMNDLSLVRHQCPDEQLEETGKLGRPRKLICKNEVGSLFDIYHNWSDVARELGVSERTLRRRRDELGIVVADANGPRKTYSDISQDQLCEVVRGVLNTLPNAGETYIIGACRSRGIHVQRWRIRDAIKVVDPVSRALRRTVSIVRRVYNVPSPNSLW